MKTICFILAIFAILLPLSAFADSLKVVDSEKEYVLKEISACNVKGLELMLSKDITRTDCNEISMGVNKVLIDGNGRGFYDQYFLDANLVTTLMYCPLKKPIKETVFSSPIFIKSFTKQDPDESDNILDKVVISVVLPKGYKLEVKETY